MILCVLLCLCVVCVPECVCGFVLLCSCLSLSFFSKMCIDGMPPFIVFILSCQSIRTQVAALVTKRARCYEKLFKKERKSTKCSDMSTSAPFIFTRIKFISRIEPMLYFLSPPKKHLESSKLLKVSGLLSGLMSKNILDSFNKAIE